jgi:hypothetical protein
MAALIDRARLQALFDAIASGRVTLSSNNQPGEIDFGDRVYRTSDGWTIVVFIDGYEFDYVDHVISPDGQRIECFDGGCQRDEGGRATDPAIAFLEAYRPESDAPWTITPSPIGGLGLQSRRPG